MASLPLLPLPEKSRLVGIARLAAEGESIREGRQVEYFTLPSKSLLNRCVSNRQCPLPGQSIPIAVANSDAATATPATRTSSWKCATAWSSSRRSTSSSMLPVLLRHELRRVKPHESIALGTATDPYQPAERRYEVTRDILEEFARHRGFELGIVTKSNIVTRDLELLQEVARSNQLSMHITITTLDVELARILEPRAPRPDLRMDAVRALAEAGLRVGMSCSPVVPGITDAPKAWKTDPRRSRFGRRLCFCESTFLEAMLGGGVSSLSRAKLSASRRELSATLSGPRLPTSCLRQTPVPSNRATAREIQNHQRPPRALRYEMAGAGIRRAVEPILKVWSGHSCPLPLFLPLFLSLFFPGFCS